MMEKLSAKEFDENYAQITEKITAAAKRSNRNSEDIILLAATKTVDAETVNYAISKGIYPLNKIKAAFEIRTASIIGFMPDVILCSSCGEGEGVFYFDIMGGSIQCAACKSKAEKTHSEEYLPHEARIVCILTPGAKTALEYCVHCPIEKILSFNISDEDMEIFAKAAQQYILNQTLYLCFLELIFCKTQKRNQKSL